VANGNSVNILEVTADGWLRIRCLHGEGYCAAEFIDCPVQATGVSNADILNVRAGAGTSYDVSVSIRKQKRGKHFSTAWLVVLYRLHSWQEILFCGIY
jgi:uncharacterized protein YgiM (DUF1202 family)